MSAAGLCARQQLQLPHPSLRRRRQKPVLQRWTTQRSSTASCRRKSAWSTGVPWTSTLMRGACACACACVCCLLPPSFFLFLSPSLHCSPRCSDSVLTGFTNICSHWLHKNVATLSNANYVPISAILLLTLACTTAQLQLH